MILMDDEWRTDASSSLKQEVDYSITACINVKDYSNFKDLIHSNIDYNIIYYKKGNYYLFPTYHSYGLRNSNNIRKSIDYKRGYQCILPTKSPYWRITKQKYKQTKFYNTRYQARYNIHALALVKGNYYYNHKTKEFEHHNLWCNYISSKI